MKEARALPWSRQGAVALWIPSGSEVGLALERKNGF